MNQRHLLIKAGVPICVFAAILLAGPSLAQEKPEASAVRTVSLASKILNETRELRIRLPEGYEQSVERYPVLIQLGGGSHFAYSTAIVDLLAKNDHIPALIVVSLSDPTPRHHYRDSTPTKVDYLPASGGAPAFLKFLKEELIPHLEANLRTQPFRILCGHGLSGLFAVYALLESPGTFGGFITDGASLTFDNSMIFEYARPKLADPKAGGFLYLGVGNEQETIPGLRRLDELLKKSALAVLTWKLEIEQDEDQGTAALPVFYKGLKWIYSGWRMPADIAAAGLPAVRAYYADLSKKYGYEIPASEKALSGRGFQLIREQRFADAEKVFLLNAQAYPDSHQVFMNLAFLFERMKDWKQAADSYEKAAEKAAKAQPDLANYYRAQAERLRKR